jgi:hypothetical protein
MKQSRIDALKKRHRELDERIQVLESERVQEQFIKQMKIDKLMLKQEIAHAEETLTGDVK